MSNSEINALENVVRTIFLPDFSKLVLTFGVDVALNIFSFLGIET